ncbi:MAG TPA: type II toxin-antitoxin system prevent-host-death family antitoxin [Longimicrobium sp.]|nr:type II toxin-antitoxin system prevent-host-death family antitoxin [Longimicrobium sp.]
MARKEIDVAQGQLADALAAVEQGEEVVLVRDGEPVARLMPMEEHALPAPLGPRKAGSARGQFTVPDDFDEPLEDFRDYM